MTERPSVALIGAGNLAWHLGPALDNAEYPVLSVCSAHSENAVALQQRLYSATVAEGLDFSDSAAGLFLICVGDDVIEDVARELVLPEGALVAHTSGSRHIDVLRFTAADDTGVLYPLQTFSRDRNIDFGQVPFLIEASSGKADGMLYEIARSLSPQVYRADSAQRELIHLAAVIASNFSNHLITLAGKLLRKHDITPDLLYPLIAETVNKAMELGPEAAQTGPARRGDLGVVDRHLHLLDNSGYSEVYALMSRLIREYYHDGIRD